ncbi:formylglycine-generating enzyme family protein [Pseudoxanthomonas sp. CF125]|uniref:formylglycine-generating enzyme family protein n=1 Tax=Pseudoxanthomonas sp. CF125 TaxID=1855303 RepID=UPI000891295B|nr:formylglycine-generating enzyme family protein [Pseudoxanthomonas sp. CF125]SDQ23529.1 Formylglycine-generating enzyme, required for sulfatase activity, contains SUMF1/FGE domain [Pseudoxanthomonas sp. CF125]
MHATRYPMRLATAALAVCLAVCLAACTRTPEAAPPPPPAAEAVDPRLPSITVSGDETGAAAWNWQPPQRALTIQDMAAAKRDAASALARNRLYAEAGDAIPLYLALRTLAPEDRQVAQGLKKSLQALLKQGAAALRDAGDDADALSLAGEIGAVARALAPDDPAVAAYLVQVDSADQLWRLNAEGERLLRNGQIGQTGETVLAPFREVLQLQPGQARALQGLAASESAMIRQAEEAAAASDFAAASRWLARAAQVRDSAPTVEDARQRVGAIRNARIAALRERGISDLTTLRGQRTARVLLAEVLRIAEPGDTVAADFRTRIDLATHYGLFRPGQAFTDAMTAGGRAPEMIVIPHGGFRMGATESELGSVESEKPAHYVRFDRGFAMSRQAITVGEFRRFVQATRYRPRATRRGHSVVYDERSGNFARRSGVDWQSDYAGARAADSLPVLHVSVRDAEAYAQWLSVQTGKSYRLPSEAEFEYVLRAGSQGRYPWGSDGVPTARFGNLTGGNDVSPSGRHWNNAFVSYGDGYWGPAPGGSYLPNAFGLYDLGSNVSEWVSDCWHASYRRAPADGASWFNPGCRSRVVRGGSWASSPTQARAAWRSASDSDMTSARVGFRVVRGI